MTEYKLVQEPWEIHDTLCVCRELYASEARAGYFTTFAAFGAQQRHLFFKRRSEAIVHRSYCNSQSEDRTDFVFYAFQLGLMFFGPPTPWDVQSYGPGVPIQAQEYLPSFWCGELPRHTSAALLIGQDKKLELQSMMLSPGYGPVQKGAALGIDDPVPGTVYMPEFVWTTTQGVPVASARYNIFVGTPEKPEPIGIPQGESIELELNLTEHAQNILQSSGGPEFYYTGQPSTGPQGAEGEFIATRYGIQATLWGYRRVQQRGELRAPNVR
jgi:hypothetical protein